MTAPVSGARIRLGVFVTHPVQYHVPIWQQLSNDNALDVNVFYFSRQGIVKRADPGFGIAFQWDRDLLSGYKYQVLSDVSVDAFDSAHLYRAKETLRNQFDVILLHGYTQTFARQILRYKRKRGYAVVLRGEFTDRLQGQRHWLKQRARRLYLQWFYHQVDSFCYVGNDAKSHLLSHGIDESRIFFSPYSVDSEFFELQRAAICRESARKALGISKDDVVFLFVGKMIPRKQPDLLARVAAKLGAEPRFKLIMLGDGPMLPAVTSRLKPLVEKNRVILAGFVNQLELGTFYRASDALVVPSLFETWGLVVNEAMHFGLPSIVSDRVGCAADLVTAGKTGDVFAHDSSDSLESMLRHYTNNSDLLNEMGNEAINRIREYSIQHTTVGITKAVRFAANYTHIRR